MVPPRPRPPSWASPRQGGGEAFQALALEGAVTSPAPRGGGPTWPAPGRTPTAPPPRGGAQRPDRLGGPLAALPLADCPSTRAIRALHALLSPRGPQGHRPGHRPGGRPVRPPDPGLYHAHPERHRRTAGLTAHTPLTATQASVQAVAEAALRAAGFAVQGDMDPPPITCRRATPSSAPLAQCYEAYTGQKGSAWPSAAAPMSTTFPAEWPSGPTCRGSSPTSTGPTKDPGGGPAHHRQDLCPSYGGTVPVSQAPF